MKSDEKVFYTFGMIKPDGMEHKEEIIKLILDAGLKIDYFKCDMLTDELINENYGHVKEKYPEDFKLLKESLKSGPVLMMLIYDSKGNAVEKYRKVLGATKSWEADPDTIRGMFGDREKVYKNTAHGSGNAKEANDEIKRFLRDDIDKVINAVCKKRILDYEMGSAGWKLTYQNKCSYTDGYFKHVTIQYANEVCDVYYKTMGK